MHGLTAAVVLGATLPVAFTSPAVIGRDIRGSLPAGASDIENKFQPVTDFDKDGCYYTSAIDDKGSTNPGIKNAVAKKPEDGCRTPDRLENSNVYSRKRCNNGICAIMYEYYFEKDQTMWGSLSRGHTHDWENIVVFVKDEKILRVAASCHNGYGNAANDGSIPLEGLHAKMVYHKDGVATHCFRLANSKDDPPENYTGKWFSGKLIGWDNWPTMDLKQKMLDAFSGGVGPKLPDHKFGEALSNAAGNNVPGFDPHKDA